mgnify:CR=1 FL=1
MKKNREETIRTFIAIELPAEIHASLQRVQDDLRESMPDVRWTKYGNVHLTLKFLGDVQVSRIDPIGSALRQIASQFSPFVVNLAGMGAFPDPRKPRIVWVGVEKGVDRLVEITNQIETAMEKLGFPREGRPFKPHLTVGRIRELKQPSVTTGALERVEVGEIGEFTVERISLIKSQLDPAGSIYTILTEALLGGT